MNSPVMLWTGAAMLMLVAVAGLTVVLERE